MQLPIAARFVDRLSGRFVEASIRVVTEEDIVAWMRWRYRPDDQDRSWDWRSIYSESRESGGRHECYAAWADGDLQGLMALDIQKHTAPDAHEVIVDYLSSNPANRATQTGLKYLGTALLAIAIVRSYELGFGGRIRLEALSGAEAFYQGLGMTRQPETSREGNAVYVFDSEGAKEFLEEIRKKEILQL